MLDRSDWKPDYDALYAWRAAQLEAWSRDATLLQAAKDFYSTRPARFISTWCDTYDPRNAGKDGKLWKMPFVLFPRQNDFIRFLSACEKAEANGLNEKSRTVGATWCAVCFSVHRFCFVAGAKIGWGSRKASLVDKIGDPDSIFEKIRFELNSIPRMFWPPGFDPEINSGHMKVFCPGFGTSITGEAGDDIGRGGRTTIYFKDESAHYEHPEAIEAALMETTRVQIDISSVNGLGNVFHRKRATGVEWEPGHPAVKGRTNVFVFDWTDHPEKTKAWYDERRADAERNGMLHLFAQEVDRDYSAAVEGTLIPSAWVVSAIDAHEKIPKMDQGLYFAGLDVADEGGDTNCLTWRKGSILKHVEEWGERDTGVTARRALDGVKDLKRVSVQYDCCGVGAGVKAEVNRLKDDELFPSGVSFVPWNAGAGPLDEDAHVVEDDDDSPTNKEFFHGLKPQGWWALRRRFEKTHEAIEKGIKYHPDELISLDSESIGQAMLRKLQKELSQPTSSLGTRMKMVVDKKPDGTKSPNTADSTMMCFFPAEDDNAYPQDMSWVTGKKRT